jgi:hypothetical protein
MKAKLICGAVLAMAASFGANAQPTDKCMAALSSEARLQPIADKVALGRTGEAALVRVMDRAASEQERTVIAVWLHKRNECFDAGAGYRRAMSTPQEIAFLRSVFVFEQRLVSDLQAGRLTYAEFNRRRIELAQAAGQEI